MGADVFGKYQASGGRIRMSEWFDMGKYGLYVWSSYGLFVLMLIWDLLWPWWKGRSLRQQLLHRARREQARQQSSTELPLP